MVCNLVGTFCIVRPKLSLKFLEFKTLGTLFDIVEASETLELSRFALSAIIETMYANKGYKYCNMVNMLRSAHEGVIDPFIK